MKLVRFIIFFIFCLFTSQILDAQVTDRAKNRAKYKTNQKVDQEVDKAIDKTFNKIGGLFKKKKKKNKDEEMEETPETTESPENSESGAVTETPEMEEKESGSGGLKNEEIQLWANKYDFVPGDKILYYDDQKNEEPGEFPSRWDYRKGNIENVSFNGENAILLDGNITPLFKDKFELPEKFTLEFDGYIGEHKDCNYFYRVRIEDQNIDFSYNGSVSITYKQKNKLPDVDESELVGKWHHFSVMVNKGSLKVYFNQHRLGNIPNLKRGVDDNIEFWACCCANKNPHYIKNVRLAEGGKKYYERDFTEGKIVTHNILFEVNKADLLPRSYAEIKRIAKVMEDHPDTRFSIEGHTDSDGGDDYNLDLSAERAIAVKNALKEMGISSDRLETKGWGEGKPIMANDSSEGKAQNRRVEFIKL